MVLCGDCVHVYVYDSSTSCDHRSIPSIDMIHLRTGCMVYKQLKEVFTCNIIRIWDSILVWCGVYVYVCVCVCVCVECFGGTCHYIRRPRSQLCAVGCQLVLITGLGKNVEQVTRMELGCH